MKSKGSETYLLILPLVFVCSATGSAQRSNNSQTIIGVISGLRTNGIGPRTARHLGEQPTADFKVGVVVESNGAKYTCMFPPKDSLKIVGRKIEEHEDLAFLLHKRVRVILRNGPATPEAGGNYNAELVRLTVLKGSAR